MMRLIIALALLVAGPALGANLCDIYTLAQREDATFKGALASYNAGLEKLPQARSLFLPSISLNANTTYNNNDIRYDGETAFPSGQRSYNSHGATLNLTQPLFRKQNFAIYDQAEAQVALAEAQLALARQDLILRVAQAYFDILLAQDNVNLAAAQKTAISEQLAQAKRNFEVGSATITDTHEAQARFDLARAQEIAAQNELELKRRALQQIIGQVPTNLEAVPSDLKLSLPEPLDMDQWVAQSQQQNLAIALQRAALEVATAEIARNRAGHYPTVDAVATYGDNRAGSGFSGVGSDTNSKTLGLQLNLPIYQGGFVNSKVREARALQEKAREDLELARRQAAFQTRQAYLGITASVAQVSALEQALVSTQSTLDSTRLGFEVGVRTNVDILNAQQQLFSARRDLAQSRYNYLLSRLRLKSAQGTLSDADINYIGLCQVNSSSK